MDAAHARRWPGRLGLALVLAVASSAGSAWAAQGPPGWEAGLRILDLDYPAAVDANKIVTAAVWYPTDRPAKAYAYRLTRRFQSKVALDADRLAPGGPFPLVVYIHGGFSSGLSVAYLAEYLARHGYVVVAPDLTDTAPPTYTRPVAFSTIRGGRKDSLAVVLLTCKRWIKKMNADRNFFLAYLEKHRLHHVSFVIDQMLSLNRDRGSLFFGRIREDAIAAIGWSEGGLTVLAKTGAHDDPRHTDPRIKAALLLSAPAAPFDKTLSHIRVPTMLMIGDNDKPALGPDLPRKLIYEEAPAPKYFLVMRNATHFAFGNNACGRLPLDQGVQTAARARAICQYALAFFQRHLLSIEDEACPLSRKAPVWAYYCKEGKPGEAREWGTEPDYSKAAPYGGIGRRRGH